MVDWLWVSGRASIFASTATTPSHVTWWLPPGAQKTNLLVKVFVEFNSEIHIFVNMESILIHPESVEQLKTVKAVLKALKIQFEPQSSVLPPHVLKSVEKGIEQYKSGQTISLQEFTDKHFSKK